MKPCDEGSPKSISSNSSLRVVLECWCEATQIGDSVFIVGASSELGCWNPDNGVELSTSPDRHPIWYSRPLDLVCLLDEFKFIVRRPDHNGCHVRWEQCSNRTLDSPTVPTIGDFSARCRFGDPEIRISNSSVVRGSDSSQKEVESVPLPGKAPPLDLPAPCWPEIDPAIVGNGCLRAHPITSNATANLIHSEISGSARTYKQKLETCHQVAKCNFDDVEATVDGLASVAVYLSLVRTGTISCSEDGTHYRPNLHANLSQEISKSVAAAVSAFSQIDSPAADVIRLARMKILPNLPSFSKKFTCSQPLTRIRDIAHRNDISRELKDEIKKTLQNKLHRCAGPEDLITTEKFLDRFLNNPGKYPDGFVQEFRIFSQELRDFFNSSTLTELLAMLPAAYSNLIVAFTHHKDKADSTSASPEELLAATEAAADLRGHLAVMTSCDPWESMQAHLAEISLEQFAFVCLSRLESSLVKPLSAAGLLNDYQQCPQVQMAMEGLIQGIRHLQLSGFQRSSNVVSHLRWVTENKPASGQPAREWTLIASAAVARCRRFVDSFTELTHETWQSRASAFGASLHADIKSVAVFSEASIRASVVFQVAKVSSLLLRLYRNVLRQPPIDLIVPPNESIVGVLVHVSSIDPSDGRPLWLKSPLKVNHHPMRLPIILWVQKVAGDEELVNLDIHFSSALSPFFDVGSREIVVGALLVDHDLPHLSHIAVRARQRHLPLATYVENQSMPFKLLDGKLVQLDFSGQPPIKEVGWEKLKYQSQCAPEDAIEINVSMCVTVSSPVVFAGSEICDSSCGGKAARCEQIARLAQDIPDPLCGIFTAPKSAVLPFGSLEATVLSVASSTDVQARLASLQSGSLLSTACSAIREVIINSRPKPKVANEIANQLLSILDPHQKKSLAVMVRSSANVEDLHHMSAAGLYDSIPAVLNVQDPSQESFWAAVATVHASLFSQRAVTSRIGAKICQNHAQMAILVQPLVARPLYSFVLHTHFGPDGDSVLAEVACGLGEILASSSCRGNPHRLKCSKSSRGSFEMLAAASYDEMFISSSNGGVSRSPVDYSKDPLTISPEFRERLAKQLSEIACHLENALAQPQDVEGVVLADQTSDNDQSSRWLNIMVLQSRAQHV